MSLKLLESIGLTKKEIEIYELLLRSGQMLPREIIKQTGLKRATAYKSLYSLEERGLAAQKIINKKIAFVPQSPDVLLEKLQEKITDEQKMVETLKVFLPDLKNTYIFASEKPIMKVYTGVEGMKAIYVDTLNYEGEICWWNGNISPDDLTPSELHWLIEEYTVERVKRGLRVRTLAAGTDLLKEHQKLDKSLLREMLFVPEYSLPFPYQVCLYGDKVAFIDYKRDSTISVVIEYPLIFNIIKSLYNLAWAQVKKGGV